MGDAITAHARVEDLDGGVYELQGRFAPGFEAVWTQFREAFELGAETGAAVCVMVDRRTVADLWGGWSDAARRRPWAPDTLVCGLSVGKGPLVACLHLLIDAGEVALEAPVADYWPSFAANGKAGVRIRHLLDHTAGLPVLEAPLGAPNLLDWESMTVALAGAQPLWPPGQVPAYHLLTIGFLIGEVVRRVSGQSIGAFIRNELAAPYDLDLHVGLGAAEQARCAEVSAPRTPAPDPERWLARAYAQLPQGVTLNTPAFRAAEAPAVNLHGTARALAGFYALLSAEGGLLSQQALSRATALQWAAADRVLHRRYRCGLGFLLNSPPYAPMGPNPAAFGHHGAGGSLAFRDPGSGLSFAYMTSRMHSLADNGPRARRLVDAAYAALAGESKDSGAGA